MEDARGARERKWRDLFKRVYQILASRLHQSRQVRLVARFLRLFPKANTRKSEPPASTSASKYIYIYLQTAYLLYLTLSSRCARARHQSSALSLYIFCWSRTRIYRTAPGLCSCCCCTCARLTSGWAQGRASGVWSEKLRLALVLSLLRVRDRFAKRDRRW